MKSLLSFCLLWSVLGIKSVIAQDCQCDIIVPAGTTTINGDRQNALSAEFVVDLTGGEIICLSAGDYPDLNIKNIKGTAEQPITIKNCGGKVRIGTSPWTHAVKINHSEHLRFTGSGDENIPYGIEITFITYREVIAPSGIVSEGPCQALELDHLEIHHTPFAGIVLKYDPKCYLEDSWQRNFLMKDIHIHHNWIHDTGSEGIYLGYTGGPIDCDNNTIFPHLLENVFVYENLLQRNGWDALQIYHASNCEVYRNQIEDYGFFGEVFQNTGIDIGWKTSAKIYENQLTRGSGIGIEIKGKGGIEVFNNQIINAGFDGIYANDVDAPIGRDAYRFQHNTIAYTGRYGIRLENFQTDPQNPNSLDLIANNLITEISPVIPNPTNITSLTAFNSNENRTPETFSQKKKNPKTNEWKNFDTSLMKNKPHWKAWILEESQHEIAPDTHAPFMAMMKKYKAQKMDEPTVNISSVRTLSTTLSSPFNNKDYIYTAQPFKVDTLGNSNHLRAENILFTNPEQGDFSLQIGSPAMDICPVNPFLPIYDRDQNPRVSGTAGDAGAIEFPQYYVEIQNSQGDSIQGCLEIYNGSTYQTYPSPLTGKWILPKTVAVPKIRLTVNNGRKTINKPFHSQEGRFYQTIPFTVELHNSAGNPLEGGRIRHSGGGLSYQELYEATNSDGVSILELLPATHKFQMTYADGRTVKKGIKVNNENTELKFQTIHTQLSLDICSDETRTYPQAEIIYKGFSKTTDTLYTDSNGEISLELLPDVYHFWVKVNGKTKKFSKVNIDTQNPSVSFPLSFTQFLNDGRVEYKANGKWFELPSEGIELLANNYRIRSYDLFGNLNFDETLTIDGCVFNYNNLSIQSLENTTTRIYPQPARQYLFTPMIPQMPDHIQLCDLDANTYPISTQDFSIENNTLKLNLETLHLEAGIYILQWSIGKESFSECFVIDN